jgi:hypothetical protein
LEHDVIDREKRLKMIIWMVAFLVALAWMFSKLLESRLPR